MKIEVKFSHNWKLSEAKYFHLFLLAVGFGSNGFILYLLNFSIAVVVNPAKPETPNK